MKQVKSPSGYGKQPDPKIHRELKVAVDNFLTAKDVTITKPYNNKASDELDFRIDELYRISGRTRPTYKS